MMDLSDILSWVTMIVLVCVYLVLLAAWESWRDYKRKRETMRRFWTERKRRGLR